MVTQARWLALLGDKAYELALTANRIFNAFRRVLGAPYWSLSKWAKLKVKNAVNYIGAFEKALATEAKNHHAGGVICGHIHTAALHDEYGLRYINCGDWVESCTAVAEGYDGKFEIITWTHVSDESRPNVATTAVTGVQSRAAKTMDLSTTADLVLRSRAQARRHRKSALADLRIR